MIEKLKVYEETPSGYKHPENIVQEKINELVDAVNSIQKHLWIHYELKTLGESSLVNTQVELELTKKKLDIAVDALKEISLHYSDERNAPESVWVITAIDMAECADKALEQINEITKGEQQ